MLPEDERWIPLGYTFGGESHDVHCEIVAFVSRGEESLDPIRCYCSARAEITDLENVWNQDD